MYPAASRCGHRMENAMFDIPWTASVLHTLSTHYHKASSGAYGSTLEPYVKSGLAEENAYV